jgi:hypothetical protein
MARSRSSSRTDGSDIYSRKKPKKNLKGAYLLEPKVEYNKETTATLNEIAGSLDSLPRVYDPNQPAVVPPSTTKPTQNPKSLNRDIGVIAGSDQSFGNKKNFLLTSDERLRNQPSQSTYSDIVREISRMMYYPGIDRLAVSRLGALMILKAKLSDASIAANLRGVNNPYPQANKMINSEVDSILSQINLLSQMEVRDRIRGLEANLTARAVTIKQKAQAFAAANSNARTSSNRDVADQIVNQMQEQGGMF